MVVIKQLWKEETTGRVVNGRCRRTARQTNRSVDNKILPC